MRLVRLGRNGPEVSAAGLGCMGMSGGYGMADDAESIATIHAARAICRRCSPMWRDRRAGTMGPRFRGDDD
jgi:hypothetical protein